MPAINTTRGSIVWRINLFRSDALTQLLNDLQERENMGLSDDECHRVQLALGRIVNAATAIPDGSWTKGMIWKELQDFADIYQEWNQHEKESMTGADLRRRDLKKLRAKRNKIAKKMRRNLHIIEQELDFALVDALYTVLNDLVSALPDVFTNLTKAVARYQHRKVS
jgi:hypothetical protein